MDTPPPDLSTCRCCGRAVPPANNPQFAQWEVAKDDDGKVVGMLCPTCRAAERGETPPG